MKIFSIETSCDETGISILEGTNSVSIRGNALASQIDLHAQYGGVFPAMAKRAHAEKFVPLLSEALTQAGMLADGQTAVSASGQELILKIQEKDATLVEALIPFLQSHVRPDLDYIAVTTGPGLEPALWVGINAARILSVAWNIPLIPINHMEGHILVTLLDKKSEKEFSLKELSFPALGLLVSGGHTELVLVHNYAKYEKIGATRDDAVGEAFDKVARMLGLPYPGGPAISRLAAEFRASGATQEFEFPRPMMHSHDYDFSYSGIKTAVLYTVRDLGEVSDEQKKALACAFEDAAIEVLVSKTLKALEEYQVQTLIVGGGVAGNTYLRNQLTNAAEERFPGTTVLFPEQWLATDNSVMIGIAAFVRTLHGSVEHISPENVKADGNLSITEGGFKK